MRNERDGRTEGILSRWCSGQNNAFVTPERRKFRRVHGLQLPLHPQQVIGWIVIFIIVINTFTILTPLLEPSLRSVFSIVFAAIFFTHVCSHAVVLLSDPADSRIRSQPANKIVPEFDRAKHLHVIENGRCHLCNITTDNKRTKHCSICNKCIVRFDHHCKWLNNCIGARNYFAFLVCMISAILASLSVAGLSVTELLMSLFSDRAVNPYGTNVTMEDATAPVVPFVTPASDTATIVAISAIGILSAIVAILLLHLCLFHGYIACLGFTTYEYIRNKREKDSVTAAVAIAAAATAAAAAAAAAATKTNTNVNVAAASATTITTTTTTTTTSDTTTDINVTITNNSFNTVQVAQHSSSSRVRHDFCGCSFFTARHSFSTPRRNDMDSCSRDTANPGRTELEGDSNLAVSRPSFSSCRENDKKEFRLCFSTYELKATNASSMNNEVSTSVSQEWNVTTTTLSTPSPVYCCFAALNSIGMHCCTTNRKINGSKKRTSGDDISSDSMVPVSTNSCEAVERIGRFFRSYLSKGKRRKRWRKRRKSRPESYDANAVQEAKPKGMDLTSIDSDRSTIKSNSSVEDIVSITAALPVTVESLTIATSRLPSKLPPLYRSSSKEFANRTLQRSQKTLGSSAHKRPGARFSFRKGPTTKTKSHLAQSMKLSPILESDFSKPATPRSARSSLSSYSVSSARSACSSSFVPRPFSSPRIG